VNYQAPLNDIHFILHDVLKAPEQLNPLVCFSDIDADLIRQVVDEAGKFVTEQIAPLQSIGDTVGCKFKDGQVTTPPGFAAAYQAFWQSGWPALGCSTEDGGQGLPTVLEAVLYEMLSGANHGWTMAPGLLHGAYECIKHHGSDTLKAQYLEKVATGEWLATMCLTEPHAGSDLGLARTKAVAQVDGSYRVSGTKIFISGGEHDLTTNIVHLVLARLPDAPEGPKGLSLFLAPKIMPDGSKNAVHCDRIEEKMGLHGSPTCVMRFDEATAWLIGEPNRGLSAMFVMMNAARLHVGLQGIGLLEAAWQKADSYSKERRQMRAPGPRKSTQAADLIAEHPAMRRILDTQRAWVATGRVLAYQTALELDLAKHHPEASRRSQAQTWCSLVTPVLKSAWTEQAFAGSSECLQVFGGHGYVREWGIEQIVRDSRVTMIYEGTNEIQAIDLLVRKVMADAGAGLGSLLVRLVNDVAQASETAEGMALQNQSNVLLRITEDLLESGKLNPELPFWVADDYLRAFSLTLMVWAGLKIKMVSQGASSAKTDNPWLETPKALSRWVLPEFEMRCAIIKKQLEEARALASAQ
jgi:alkylation response protein AidB-like acyl-CoA dehydrogenase